MFEPHTHQTNVPIQHPSFLEKFLTCPYEKNENFCCTFNILSSPLSYEVELVKRNLTPELPSDQDIHNSLVNIKTAQIHLKHVE